MFKAPGQRVWNGNERARKAAFDKTRPSAAERGYDKAWFQFRARYLRANPQCQHPGCTERATEVHHLKRVKTHPQLKLDIRNVMGFCKPHHSQRTATEDSFSRRV